MESPGPRTGTRFGPYELRSLLGKGGMGEVYEAYDTVKDRVVAVKLLHEELAGDPVYQVRFRRESQAAARVAEPHIVPIHDWGVIDGVLFIDMQLIPGVDLRTLLRSEGPLTPVRAVGIIEQIASALDAAHAGGLVHRDVKPANILVTEADHAYLADFGIAHTQGDSAVTVVGMAVGSYIYMAPERFDVAEITGRADIYSLACVLHECLTGASPFPAASMNVLIRSHLADSPPRASSQQAGIPAGFDAVISRGMAKDPADRWPSASEMAAAARAALTTAPPTGPMLVVRAPAKNRGAVPPESTGEISAVILPSAPTVVRPTEIQFTTLSEQEPVAPLGPPPRWTPDQGLPPMRPFPDAHLYTDQPAAQGYPAPQGFAAQSGPPGYPHRPDSPGHPEEPGAQGFSAQSGYLDPSGAQEHPAQSNVPGHGENSGSRRFPEQPGTPDYPARSASPGFADNPAAPRYPGQSGAPRFAEEAAAQDYPERSDGAGFADDAAAQRYPERSGRPGSAEDSAAQGYPGPSGAPGFADDSAAHGYSALSGGPGLADDSAAPGYSERSGAPGFADRPDSAGYAEHQAYSDQAGAQGYTEGYGPLGDTGQPGPQAYSARSDAPDYPGQGGAQGHSGSGYDADYGLLGGAAQGYPERPDAHGYPDRPGPQAYSEHPGAQAYSADEPFVGGQAYSDAPSYATRKFPDAPGYPAPGQAEDYPADHAPTQAYSAPAAYSAADPYATPDEYGGPAAYSEPGSHARADYPPQSNYASQRDYGDPGYDDYDEYDDDQYAPPAKGRSIVLPILIAVATIVVISVGGVVGWQVFGSGTVQPKTTSDQQAAAPGPSTSAAAPAPATSSTPPVTTTPTKPGAVTLPAGAKPCNQGTPVQGAFTQSATGSAVTSCQFAEEVRRAYAEMNTAQGGSREAPRTVVATSPVTGRAYTMSCRSEGQLVTCSGGENAVVYVY
ncbi:serine/threonine-protein kinase [Nocardia brasiliensis]|uniref:non-specific serine/threonine protein kinase n=1 Tax=Nocardia brasiliensis (strain ATCC 700358 / HUJEG-1) TaxID=1133849 RepID=K0F518_NOCB7|nr:serine/threonine protein kinase [Nocardia brasiliensis ATCC 700358]